MEIRDSEIVLHDGDNIFNTGNTCIIYNSGGFEQFIDFNKQGKIVLDTCGLIMYLTHELHLTQYEGTALLYKDEQWIDAVKYVQSIYSKYNGYNSQIKNTIDAVINSYCNNPLSVNNIAWNKPEYIEFNNGVYSFVSNKLLPKSYDKYQTIKIDCDYVEGATSALLDKTLSVILPNERVREAYLSYLGYIFYKDNLKFGKWAVNYGLTHTCKSTFGDIMANLLNRSGLVAIVQPKDIGGKFDAKYFHNKLLLYCDDLTDGYIPDTGAWKSGATGSIERIEAKGKDAFTSAGRSYYKLIANSNKLLTTKEGEFDDAMKRRTIVFPFNEQITEDDPRYNPNLIGDLSTEKVTEALVYKSIQAFQKVLKRGQFDETEEMAGYLHKLVNTNRKHELLVQELNFDYIRCTDAYKIFKEECINRNMKPMSYDWFIDTVNVPIIANHFMSGEHRLINGMLISEALQVDNKANDKEHLYELGFQKWRTQRQRKNVYVVKEVESEL